MENYEKLGVFYLGRYHDLAAGKTLPDLLLYNSNDLLTHALCVGMTGSGKTGLCFDLIEEAALDGIPAILIDPKGDLANLLLTFPELRPADFEPWVDPEEARRKGISPAEHATQQAELWKTGLAKWQQDGDRIRRLREAAEFAIYTPGSNAGIPVSILSSFAAPDQAILDDPELLRERVNATVSSLLGLIGVDADPTKSREAILLSTILQHAWQQRRNLDLGALIGEIQSPPVTRIGVMDVDTFFPAAKRFELATAINGLVASPGFNAWLEGEPMDIQRLYYTPAGKPRVAIFSIAHLGDVERMFFVTLLLNQLLGWMRTQAGTTSLRALLYMDEIFGYFPPVANPPSKLPLLTLLKQGRAFGVGAVLATQNPVDLDYKGLANIGTWFLGRLQTERDKLRVLDGLEGAAAGRGSGFDRAAMERTLAGLGSRIFLMHNVHEDAASVFESRWAMSYLRGPMTRNQIRAAMGNRGTEPAPARASSAPAGARIGGAAGAAPENRATNSAQATARPSLPPEIPQYFVPSREAAAHLVYRPMLLGAATIRFTDPKARIDASHDVVLATPIRDRAIPVDWSEASEVDVDLNDLERTPTPGISFEPVPAAAAQAKNYAGWQRDFVNALYSSRKLTLHRSTNFGQVSLPQENEGDFRIRLRQLARERRDALTAKLREKYEAKVATLNERLRRAEQAAAREADQAKQAKLSSALSIGGSLLGAFLGRKSIGLGTLSRAGTAVRSVSRATQQSADVARAAETVDSVRQQLAQLESEFKADAAEIESGHDPATESLETVELRPSKSNIAAKLVALAWIPSL